MKGLRGVAAGVLTLIAMQALSSGKGPQQGGKLLMWVADGLRRAMAADVAAIPSTKRAAAGKPPPPKDTGSKSEVGGSLPRNPTITT